MRQIVMLRTEKGSENGVNIKTYLKGQEYNLPDNLAECFVEHLRCAEYKVTKTETPEPVKMMETSEPSAKPWKSATKTKTKTKTA